MLPTVLNRTQLAHLLRWAIVCWVIVFWRLDYAGLVDDGAHYAQLTREMLLHRSWLVPLLDGSPFIDKPIFFHWVQGLAFVAFGTNELTARLPSATAAVALFVVTRVVGQRLLGARVGERAWLMLATVPATFVLSRVGYLDMLFAMLLFGSVACLWAGATDQNRRLRHIGCALLVLATMTKGPVAFVLAASLFGLAWLAGGDYRRTVRAMDWPLCLALTVMGSSPWFIWMHGRFGDTFVRDYLLLGHVWYLAPRQSASSNASGFYLEMFVTVFFPWSLVTIGYFVDTIRRWRAGHRPPIAEGMLWLWIATVIVLFTAARFRVDRYIYPAAPACCLLAARGWLHARERTDRREYFATRIGILMVAALLAATGIVLGIRLPTLALDISPTAFAVPVILVTGGVVVGLGMLKQRLRPVLLDIPAGVLVAVYALVVLVGLPVFERTRPVKQVGEWLHAQSSGAEVVGLYKLDRWQPMLRYYADRPLRRLEDEEQVRAFLAAPGRRWLVTRREDLARVGPAFESSMVRLAVPAVVGTEGRGVRRQIWGEVVVVGTSNTERAIQVAVTHAGIAAGR